MKAGERSMARWSISAWQCPERKQLPPSWRSLSPAAAPASTDPKRSRIASRSRSAAAPAVHPRGGVDPGFAGAVVDDREYRAAPVKARPGLGRVGRPQLVGGVGGD